MRTTALLILFALLALAALAAGITCCPRVVPAPSPGNAPAATPQRPQTFPPMGWKQRLAATEKGTGIGLGSRTRVTPQNPPAAPVSERTQTSAAPIRSVTTRSVTIQVILGDTHQPARTGAVFFGDAANPTTHHPTAPGSSGRKFPCSTDDIVAHLERNGTPVELSKVGLVKLVLPLGAQHVAARSGQHEGHIHLPRGLFTPPGGEPVRLTMQLQDRWTLRTVDAQGVPIGGIPLGIRRSESSAVESVGTSHPVFGTLSVLGSRTGQAVIDAPGMRDVGRNLNRDASAHAGNILDITVPPRGTVTIILTDHVGQPIVNGTVSLDTPPPAIQSPRDPAAQRSSYALQGTTDDMGCVQFGPLGVQRDYPIHIRHRSARVDQQVVGPRSNGGNSTTHIRLEPAPARLTALVVDSNGTPLTQQPTQLTCTIEGAPTSIRAHSDGVGRVQFDLPEAALGMALENAQLELLTKSNRLTGIRAPLEASPCTPGERWLGTVVLCPTPQLVAGSSTLPVPVSVAFTLQRFDLSINAWVPVSDAAFGVLGHGRFEYRLASRPGLYRLSPTAQHPNMEREIAIAPIEFTPGTTGLHIATSNDPSLRLATQHPRRGQPTHQPLEGRLGQASVVSHIQHLDVR